MLFNVEPISREVRYSLQVEDGEGRIQFWEPEENGRGLGYIGKFEFQLHPHDAMSPEFGESLIGLAVKMAVLLDDPIYAEVIVPPKLKSELN